MVKNQVSRSLLPQYAFRNEKEFEEWVKRAAWARGWLYYHTHRSRSSQPGFPDCVLVRKGVILFFELKMPGNKTTPAQDKWLNALDAARGLEGGGAFVFYPQDIDKILEILG